MSERSEPDSEVAEGTPWPPTDSAASHTSSESRAAREGLPNPKTASHALLFTLRGRAFGSIDKVSAFLAVVPSAPSAFRRTNSRREKNQDGYRNSEVV